LVNQTIAIREVDGVEIVSLMDNSVDFISTIQRKEVQQVRNWVKDRMGGEWIKKYFRLPFAEHGFSVLIRVLRDGKSHLVLFDTGISQKEL